MYSFCCNYIGWSNQGKYYEIEMHCAKQDVATLLYDKANIFRFDNFCLKTQTDWLSRLATWVTIPDTHGSIPSNYISIRELPLVPKQR